MGTSYLIKEETLQNIADSIRQKTDEPAQIAVSDFADKILKIEAGADVSGTVNNLISVHNTATDSHSDIREAINGKLNTSELPTAINTALAQAKASGEFDGANGKDGISVTVKSVSESTEDGGSNVVEFSDGKTLTVKNGSKGGDGDISDFTTNVGDVIPSKNLLDGVFEWGRIGQDGYNYDKDNPITGSFRTKNYIPVTGGRTIALYYARAQWNGDNAGLTMNIAQYDANKVVINGRENFIPYAANQKTFNLNENTVYIKIARPSSTTVITDSLDEIEIGVYYIEDFVSEFIPYEPTVIDNIMLDPRKIATSLYGKKIVYDGDSICESRTGSTANNGGGYAKIIEDLTGCKTVNQAVGGARLCANTERHSIVNNLSNLPTDGDLYCFQGGINDYWGNTPIGTCNQADYTGTLDTSTICGALETVFRHCLTNFVGKPVCFVITHKVKNTGHSENTNGDTFRDYRDAMVEVCEKYSIPYYDAFMESGLNGMIAEQSNTYLNAGAGGTEGDGTHPNEEGYKRYYVPQLIQLFERIMPI